VVVERCRSNEQATALKPLCTAERICSSNFSVSSGSIRRPATYSDMGGDKGSHSSASVRRGPLSLGNAAQRIFSDHIGQQHIHERAATRAATGDNVWHQLDTRFCKGLGNLHHRIVA
jgi:hypothetical protein